jgi:predicted membrane-bound mannosyltransferase
VMLVAFTVFVVVTVLFYSSFLRNYPKGVSDALQTLALWRKRTHEHEHPWWQYISWLLQEEGIILTLGGIGALIAVWRADNRFALYIAQVAFGLLAAYSLVGYKTPWISLNFIMPLALAGGYALNVAYEKLREFQQPKLFFVPVVLIVAFCSYQMYQLNFVHYDDDQYVYVYAHTRRETLAMLDQIERIGNQLKAGNDTGIALLSPEYWPLPWYFRNYHRVGYYQKVVPTTEPIIIAQTGQEEELKTTFGDEYRQIDSSQLGDARIDPQRNPGGSFSLRPGVDLLLYVRKDVPR